MTGLRHGALRTAAVTVIVLSLSGCSGVEAVRHAGEAAAAASALADTLGAAPGVQKAAARYNVVDGNGDIVFLRVTLAPGTPATRWSAVEDLITKGLTGPDLAQVRQKVRITTAGSSPAVMEYGSLQDWRGRTRLTAEVDRWTALRKVLGVAMTMSRPAATGAAAFRIHSAADSRTFMRRAGAVGSRLAKVRVDGYGFSGYGPIPPGTSKAYQRMLASHHGLPALQTGQDPLPAAGLSWSDRSWRVTVVAPPRALSPSTSDRSLATDLKGLRAKGVAASFSWVNGTTSASVAFTSCRRGRLVAEESDRELATALARQGRSSRATARPGNCV